jgi:hypothetical protein
VLLDVRARQREETVAPVLAMDRDVDRVVPRLEPEDALERNVTERPPVRPTRLQAVEPALVVLLDAARREVRPRADGRAVRRAEDVAGLVELLEQREVRPQPELVAGRVRLQRDAVGGRELRIVVDVEVLAIAAAAFRRIDRAEAVEPSRRHLRRRNLARRVPVRGVDRARHRELRAGGRRERAFAVEIVAREVLGIDERPVRIVRLSGEHRLHVTEHRRQSGDVAHAVERAAFGEQEALVELLLRHQVHAARRREVAEKREVRTLPELKALEGLRDHEVEVGVALAVRMADQVHGQPVDGDGEVGAVVGVEATDQILRCLAAALMLSDDEPGDVVQDLLHRLVRACLEVTRTNLVGGCRRECRRGFHQHLGQARLRLGCARRRLVCRVHDGPRAAQPRERGEHATPSGSHLVRLHARNRWMHRSRRRRRRMFEVRPGRTTVGRGSERATARRAGGAVRAGADASATRSAATTSGGAARVAGWNGEKTWV